MRTSLVLWDIDHTLLVSGPAGRSVYPRAFTALTGGPPPSTVPTEGRTEPEIMAELLALHGVRGIPAEESAAAMTAALRDADDELRSQGRRLPGALEALTALQGDPRVVQSLLTGNLRPNALRKLAAFGLHELVDFEAGAYGSDDPVRARLVPVAQRRAGERYGTRFDRENTVLVGDTLRDVAAGVEGGARVVAVATGEDTAEDLLAAGAEAVLPDLRATSSVVALLAGAGGPGRTGRRAAP
ncbi:haloacid dehalogenase [Streptomyces sulfonofaciens]|uniref:Haloacid dehalogenase n=1 Tax=Streptomyces sulfonofaciens TaxID=68272 RepID=A0A919L9B2_9ACTN|nr:HAD hydrolase-like protein [Streptomyces sulfonofaciens]GHH87476.1 haloacid dehalogenase [Streptomyces sulfonofaciens]